MVMAAGLFVKRGRVRGPWPQSKEVRMSSETVDLASALKSGFEEILADWLEVQADEGIKRTDLISAEETTQQSRALLAAFARASEEGATEGDFDFGNPAWDQVREVLGRRIQEPYRARRLADRDGLVRHLSEAGAVQLPAQGAAGRPEDAGRTDRRRRRASSTSSRCTPSTPTFRSARRSSSASSRK